MVSVFSRNGASVAAWKGGGQLGSPMRISQHPGAGCGTLVQGLAMETHLAQVLFFFRSQWPNKVTVTQREGRRK